MLADDSPLHQLPSTSLDRGQVLYLDGIVSSVEMVSIAYQRLKVLLHEHELSGHNSHAWQMMVLMDAWSMVDSAHRLGDLVEYLKRIGGLERGSAVKSLVDSLRSVGTLRDAVQHLYGQVATLRQNGRPLWGTLSWFYMPSPDAKDFRIGLMIPGTLARTKGMPMVNPLGRECEVPIGLVELTAAGVTVCLTDVMRAVERFAGRLERAAADAFVAIPDGATDVIAPLNLPCP